MREWFQATAADGSLILAMPVALIAGLVAFFSPCVLPMIPAYFSYATGISAADLSTGDFSATQRGRLVLGSVLFVAGFAVVFMLLGVVAGGLGRTLNDFTEAGNLILGSLLVVFGVVLLGWLPRLQRDVRVHWVPQVGVWAAPLLGFLFGLGWTPCVGPTLGAIQTLAFNEGSAARGALLSAIFAVGMGLPFVAAGVFYERALAGFARLRPHLRRLQVVGGLLLIGIGIAMLTGWWEYAVSWLQLKLVEVSVPAL